MNSDSLVEICQIERRSASRERENPNSVFITNRPDSHVRVGEVNTSIPDALYRDTDAGKTIQREKPVHRQMQELALKGYSEQEIATITGYSRGQVGAVLHQPWARERMTERAKETVNEEIKRFLEQEALPSLQILKSIANDPNAKNADRVKAADSLADRFLGKAAQPITSASAIEPKKLTTEELLALAESNGLLGEAGATGPSDNPVELRGVGESRTPEPRHTDDLSRTP